MTFLQFLLVFWLGGVIAYGLASFAIIKRDGLLQVGSLQQHIFAFFLAFLPGVLLWPVLAILDVVREDWSK